jgi:hypothetical protein
MVLEQSEPQISQIKTQIRMEETRRRRFIIRVNLRLS